MAPSPVRRVVVVGTSLAGLRGSEQLRRAGYRGALHLVGREPHFPPYDRPPLSKEVLSGERALEAARLRIFEELDAAVLPGRAAVGLDVRRGEVRLDDGAALGYDGLLIATGAAVRTIGCDGADLPGVQYFRTAEDCARLSALLVPGARLAVVGAGFIGSEIAATARQRGVAVTLIDSADLPMAAQIGEVTARYLIAQHERHGVTVRLGTGVAAIEGTARAEAVRLADGTSVPADLVVVGVGVVPETAWLEGAGLLLANGVVCDEHCRAIIPGPAPAGPGIAAVSAAPGDEAVPNVVAAGDVACWRNPRYGALMRVEHWTNAVEQAEYAAGILLHGPDGRAGYASVPYFWSDQYDMHLQFAGTRGTETVLAEGSPEDRQFIMLNRADGRDVGVIAVNWPARFGRHRRGLAARDLPGAGDGGDVAAERAVGQRKRGDALLDGEQLGGHPLGDRAAGGDQRRPRRGSLRGRKLDDADQVVLPEGIPQPDDPPAECDRRRRGPVQHVGLAGDLGGPGLGLI
jgi:3-phenylpropionate/trans-cinnamate dioxygenase ferredoxin reductase subunit